jgi:hypothetical protein
VTSTNDALQATIIVPPGYEEAGQFAAVAFAVPCDEALESGSPTFDKRFDVVPNATGDGVVATDATP